MQTIIYKSFLPKQETSKSEETSISPPSGIYRPQYNWKDEETSQREDTTSQQETQQSQEVVVSPTWTNPTGTTIISDVNDPIYKQLSIIDETNPILKEKVPLIESTKRTRGTHQFKSSDIQVGNMKELLDRFADAGISLRITSGYRPEAITSSGNKSWHAEGYALDITPIAGQTYENLKQQLRNNPELVKWMQDNGFGIIDETTPEMQSRTGATGAHWHIGKDKLAQSGLQAILSARHGIKLPIIYAKPGRKLEKQRNRVTEQLLSINHPRYQDPLTNTDKPLEPISIASILPGTGDIAEGASIINDIAKGNIGSALLGTTLFLIPGAVTSKTKTLFKPTYHSYLSERLRKGSGNKIGIPEIIDGKHIADAMEEVPIYITPEPKGGAYHLNENAIFIDPSIPKEAYPDIIEHERLHWLDFKVNQTNDQYRQDNNFLNLDENYNYLSHNIHQLPNEEFRDISEFSPRIVQIKQFKKISDPDYQWKNGELEQSWKEYTDYLKSMKIDNMSKYTKSVKDWNKATQWTRKAVPVIITPFTLPILNFNNDGTNKE